jgi:AraC family transcriptional regulator of adaptative response/methylated-DNA-[protein]-cysteine methyltransferase
MIEFGDSPEELQDRLTARFPAADHVAADRDFAEQVARVLAFLKTPDRGLELPLDVQGTAFQRRVWQALRKIPVGSTMTYASLAKQIGKPNAIRAVASACAANPTAIAIPCHRVIGSDGELHGYRWGIERKRELLKRENRDGNAVSRNSSARP